MINFYHYDLGKKVFKSLKQSPDVDDVIDDTFDIIKDDTFDITDDFDDIFVITDDVISPKMAHLLFKLWYRNEEKDDRN